MSQQFGTASGQQTHYTSPSRLARLANETSYDPEAVSRIFEMIQSQCRFVERIAPLFRFVQSTLYVICLLLMLIF